MPQAPKVIPIRWVYFRFLKIFVVKLTSFSCSVRPALLDSSLHAHSASARGKVSGGRSRSFYLCTEQDTLYAFPGL